MTTAFQANAFQNNAFQIDSTPAVVTIDTHDGFDHKRHRKLDEERKLLQRQIKEAIYGPQPEVAEAILADYAEPQQTDSVYRPLYTRLDWERVWQKRQEIEIALLLAKARADEDDDDEIILLS